MDRRLEGRTAIVSGAARGLGAAIAEALAREGASVYLGDVLCDDGSETADAIRVLGGSASFVNLDVTQAADWESVIARAVEDTGRLDVLVNNAGIYRAPGVEATTLDVWNAVIAVNLTGTLLGMQAAIPVLRRSGGGAIVNISSVVTFAAGRTGAAYQASKGGVLSLTKAAAIELANDGIRVNSVHPGSIDTPMAANARAGDPDGMRQQAARHPLGRLARPDEIAQAVVYLASDDSSFVTGASLVVDGGFSVW